MNCSSPKNCRQNILLQHCIVHSSFTDLVCKCVHPSHTRIVTSYDQLRPHKNQVVSSWLQMVVKPTLVVFSGLKLIITFLPFLSQGSGICCTKNLLATKLVANTKGRLFIGWGLTADQSQTGSRVIAEIFLGWG